MRIGGQKQFLESYSEWLCEVVMLPSYPKSGKFGHTREGLRGKACSQALNLALFLQPVNNIVYFPVLKTSLASQYVQGAQFSFS